LLPARAAVEAGLILCVLFPSPRLGRFAASGGAGPLLRTLPDQACLLLGQLQRGGGAGALLRTLPDQACLLLGQLQRGGGAGHLLRTLPDPALPFSGALLRAGCRVHLFDDCLEILHHLCSFDLHRGCQVT
jgi:hypothetical protein